MSMADTGSNPDGGEARERRSVLSELPRTRPQRPSRRREASRAGRAGGAGAGTGGSPRPAKSPRTARSRPAPEEPIVPPQGFEPDEDLAAGTPVEPPSALEVAGSLAGLAGELAQTGLAATARLLKGALSRVSGD